MSATPRPFRFIAPMPPVRDSLAAWRDELRRIEDLGYASISVSEHVTPGWSLDAMGALLAIADATRQIRVVSLVLSADLRHPVMLHKGAATLDLLSGGRLELGIGAGWLADDARALGAEPPTPASRVDRLAETLEVLEALFLTDGPVTYHGRHVRVDGVVGEPHPVPRRRPPLLVGGVAAGCWSWRPATRTSWASTGGCPPATSRPRRSMSTYRRRSTPRSATSGVRDGRRARPARPRAPVHGVRGGYRGTTAGRAGRLCAPRPRGHVARIGQPCPARWFGRRLRRAARALAR